MFKLFFGENKKLRQNPTYYLVFLLIIASIIVLAINFSPAYSFTLPDISDKSVDEIQEEFVINKDNYEFIDNAYDILEAYKTKNVVVDGFNNDLTDISVQISSFIENSGETSREDLKHSFSILANTFKDISSSKTPVYFLINKTKFKKYVKFFENAKEKICDAEVSDDALRTYLKAKDVNLYISRIKESIKDFNVDNEYLEGLKTVLDEAKEFIDDRYYFIISENPEREALVKSVNEYYLMNKTCLDYVNNSVYKIGLSVYSDSEIASFVNFSATTLYDINEASIISEYMIKNKITLLDYTLTPALNNSGSYRATRQDFILMAVQISFIIIIAYIMLVCSYTIAGEFSRGTLKLLLIKPFKRYKVILSKINSAFYNGILYLLFAAIFSSIVAGFMHLPNALSIITTFNSESVMIISSGNLLKLLFASLALKLFVSVIFFVMLSTCFNREFYATMANGIVFIITMIINGVNTKFGLLSYLPNSNISIFKFFGGSRVVSGFGNLIMAQKATFTFDFHTTIIYIVAIVVASLVVTLIKFNRLDVK